jgi:hypothetical protein
MSRKYHPQISSWIERKLSYKSLDKDTTALTNSLYENLTILPVANMITLKAEQERKNIPSLQPSEARVAAFK